MKTDPADPNTWSPMIVNGPRTGHWLTWWERVLRRAGGGWIDPWGNDKKHRGLRPGGRLMFGITEEQYDATAEWGAHDPTVLKAALDWDGVMFGESFLEVHEDGRRRRIPPHRVVIRPRHETVEVKS